MQYIIFIGNENLNINAVKSIEHYHNIATEISGNRYYVDYGTDHIFYDDQNVNFDYYEKAEIDKLPFKEPHFVMMLYTSRERMREVIRQDNFLKEVYVDNDYGLIVPIDEFIKLGMPLEK